jgi:hypothetical protein
MADGPTNKMQYDFGICGECKYTTEELVRDYPNGSSNQEATALLINNTQLQEPLLVVTPHRLSCSFHTSNHAKAPVRYAGRIK